MEQGWTVSKQNYKFFYGLRNAYKILLENLKGTDHKEDLGIDGKIISEW
jgi:hypothetical protein